MFFVIILSIFTVFIYFKWKLTYWNQLGLPTLNPYFFFGDTKDLLLGSKSLGDQLMDLHNQCKNKGYKHACIYISIKPFYLPTDPEMIKNICQNDFDYFVNRSHYMDEKNDPLSGHIIHLKDNEWKNMRKKLTTMFTATKIKMMFEAMVTIADNLKNIIDHATKNSTPLDLKDVLGCFTTDVISLVSFGLESNSLQNPDAPLRKYGLKIFETDNCLKLKTLLQFILPSRILNVIKFKHTKQEVENYFLNLVKETVDYREKHKIERNDLMHLLIQLKNDGYIQDDNNSVKTVSKLTINQIAPHAYVFYFAGFEPSSTTATFALVELAVNSDVQEKVRQEMRTVLKNYNNELTFEALQKMN